MTTITADGALLVALRQANGLTEIRDADGTVVGFFAPVSVERAHLYAQAAAQISPADVKRRKEEGGKTHTTQAVVQNLDSLETS
jgi:hypothetical protein